MNVCQLKGNPRLKCSCSFRSFLRADVCKYRPEVGKIFEKSQKIMYTTLGILVMKI